MVCLRVHMSDVSIECASQYGECASQYGECSHRILVGCASTVPVESMASATLSCHFHVGHSSRDPVHLCHTPRPEKHTFREVKTGFYGLLL